MRETEEGRERKIEKGSERKKWSEVSRGLITLLSSDSHVTV